MTQPRNSLQQQRQKRGSAALLGRYVGGKWLKVVILTWLALGAFVALVNGLEALRYAAKFAAVTPGQAALMSLLKLPDQLLLLLPFAVLLGTLVWQQQLKKTSEWVAMGAAGLPMRRLLVAPLLMCLMLGSVAVVVGNPLSATLLKRHDRWEVSISPPAARGLLTERGSLWLRQDSNGSNMFLYGRELGQLETDDGQIRPQLRQATLFMFAPDYALQARLDATQAVLEEGQWRLNDVVVLQPGRPIREISSTVLPTSLTPGALAASLAPPATLNGLELYELRKVLVANGWPANAHTLTLAQLLSLPFFMVALLLLAVPMGLRHSRHGGLARAAGLGLGIGFAFFLLRNWVGAYAVAGRLDPWLAAVAPIAVGLLLAAFLFTLVREE